MQGPTTWIVGSSSSCDIEVQQTSVSRQHCRLMLDRQRWMMEDLGSRNGTFVDGVLLTPRQPVEVTANSRITLGLTTPMPWPTAAPKSLSQTPTGRVIRIGRAADNDVVIDYPMIGREHARVFEENGRWVIEDLNSRNGVAVNRVENRVTRSIIRPEDSVYLGSYKLPASRILSSRKTEIGEAAKEPVNFSGNELVIGRDPACDQPLDYPMISWHHAKLTRTSEGIVVEDLGSRNGTFVNSVRITSQVKVNAGDQIGLGSFRFQVQDSGGLVRREYHGNVTIEASGVSVVVPKGKRLIEPVSFTIFPSELVALMGPAGAGKTTLLKALNGYTHPAEGHVLFNGASLYEYYDLFRLQMGYVPQDDIVHPQLTVREALYFSVKQRTDLTDSEIEARIDRVLSDLNISDKKHTVIGSPERKVLSGGQRKRVNIALELIHDTPVLFLDEPTSGLSSYDADGVVRLLKRLSREGKTIITTIHQPSLDMFREFDDLIMMARDPGGCGAMAFFGPAYPDSILFFNKRPVAEAAKSQTKDLNPEMLLSGLAMQSTADWQKAYQDSPYRKQFVDDRVGRQPTNKGDEQPGNASRPFDLRQWMALTQRNAICKLRDRAQTAILLAQAPLFAALIVAVAGTKKPYSELDIATLTKNLLIINFLMVVAAIWFGCNGAARDVVGEWTVYQRERMVSLKLPSYVLSKLAVLLVICTFQCTAMLSIVWIGCGLRGFPANFFAQLGILLLAAMIGGAIGLCISARAATTESAIALLPVVLLPMIALAGGLVPIYTLAKPIQVLTYVVPSRWAFEANLSNEGGKNPDGTLMWPMQEVKGKPVGGDAAGQRLLNPKTGEPLGVPAPVPEWVKDEVKEVTKDGLTDDQPARPAAQDERNAPDVHPFRLPLWRYFAILSGMLVVVVSAALGLLRSRDVH